MKHASRKKLLWISAVILLLVALYFLVLEPLAESRLQSSVNKALPDFYRFTVQDVDIDLIPLGVEATGVVLNANPENIAESDTVGNVFQGQIARLEITGFHLFDFIFSDKLRVNRIKVVQPAIRMTKVSGATKEGRGGGESSLEEISVGKINIEEGRFTYDGQTADTFPTLVAQEIFFEVDGATVKLPGKDVSIDDFSIRIPGITHYTGDSLYLMKIASLRLRSRDSTLQVDSVTIEPRLSRSGFMAAIPYQQSMIRLSLPEIAAENIDYQAIVKNRFFKAGYLRISRPDLYVFKDMRLPPPPEPFRLPSEQLKAMNQKLKVDSIEIKDGRIEYAEVKEGSEEPGVITFERLNAAVSNVTTLESSQGAISATADFLGIATLDVDFTYPQGFQEDSFRIRGTLGAFQMPQLNQITRNLAFVTLEEGRINEFAFDFSANKHVSAGRMRLGYEDMQVRVIGKKGNGNPIATTLADVVLIEKNPRNGDFRVGEIRFEREEKKAIFNYWWKSLLSGVKSTVLKPGGDADD